MTIALHWLSGSPYAWRVQLALLLKGLEYTSHIHQMSTGELSSPEYLALNPRGRVPTLVDDGYVVYESMAILAYLDRKYPGPPLFGTTAEQAGAIWRAAFEYTAYVDPAVEDFILPLYRGEADSKVEQIQRAAEVLEKELALMDGTLARSPFLTGDALTAADLVYFPAVKSIERAGSKDAARPFALGLLPLAERWPNIRAWTARVEALPGYARTYPPHWRQ